MSTAHRALTTILAGSLVVAPLSGTLLASEPPSPSTRADQSAQTAKLLSAVRAPVRPSPFVVSDEVLMANTDDVSAASQWGRHHGGHHHGHNDAAQVAIILGTIGAITGAALLVYANRPECNAFPNAGGCGYGTKVTGGAILAGGIASITIGAVSWH
jgi:hypothetical protein